MKPKFPIPEGSIVERDIKVSRIQEHPVRGDPIFVPGILAMVFGFTLGLAGIAYNATLDISRSRTLGICLIGIGIFLLVFGEVFCLFICFSRSKKIEKWNQENCEPLLKRKFKGGKIFNTNKDKNEQQKKAREWIKCQDSGMVSFELRIHDKRPGYRDKQKEAFRASGSRMGQTQFTRHGPGSSRSSKRLPSDPPSYEEALRK